MRFSTVLVGASALLPTTLAYPGMATAMSDIIHTAALSKRDDPVVMIGDLKSGATTPVGQLVQSCLNGQVDCYDESKKTYQRPGALGSSACKADACCVWDYIQEELMSTFRDSTGKCTSDARQAIRLGFHDAGQWSTTSGYGGADGSIVLSPLEILRNENLGLQGIQLKANTLRLKYGVGAADLVQFMAKVGIVACPLGPRMRMFVGRADNATPNPAGLLPDVNANAASLISLFGAKTIGPMGLVALVGAHSSSQQFFHGNLFQQGDSQDPTPGIWDVSFYNFTVSGNSNNVDKFASDVTLSKNSPTAALWKSFMIADTGDAQEAWNTQFAKAYLRLSLLGVNRINKLVDCTKVMPDEVTVFNGFPT